MIWTKLAFRYQVIIFHHTGWQYYKNCMWAAQKVCVPHAGCRLRNLDLHPSIHPPATFFLHCKVNHFSIFINLQVSALFLFFQMFVVTAYFNILTESVTSYISFAIAHFSEAYVSVQRIKVCICMWMLLMVSVQFQCISLT
jgi:hypothetical protein